MDGTLVWSRVLAGLFRGLVRYLKMSRIYLSPPDVGDLEREALLGALESGWIAPLGPAVTCGTGRGHDGGSSQVGGPFGPGQIRARPRISRELP